MSNRLRQYENVRVVRLLHPPEHYDGWRLNERPPAIGDVGTIVDILQKEGLPDNYVVACAAPARDGTDIWLGDFLAEELEPYGDAPSDSVTIEGRLTGEGSPGSTRRMTRLAALAMASATLSAIGGASFWLLFRQADVSTRAVCVDGQVCTEYFSLKDGLRVNSVCPSRGGERYSLGAPCTKLEREAAVGTALQAHAGGTARTTLVVIPKASGVLWAETRAAVLRGVGVRLHVIGGESIRVGRKAHLGPTTGPVIELGTVTAATPVELAVEVEIPALIEPGEYETQLTWTVADAAPGRINQNPVAFVIDVAP